METIKLTKGELNHLVSNCGDFEKPETYQVYLNGNWIADCNSYEEAETIANGNAMNGSINIERI